jgi:hypothetical protein
MRRQSLAQKEDFIRQVYRPAGGRGTERHGRLR